MGWLNGNGNHLVASYLANVAELDGQIIARLPLKVEGVVNRVRQFVLSVVDTEGDRLPTVDDRGRVGKVSCEIRGFGVGRRGVLHVGVREFQRARSAAAASGDVVIRTSSRWAALGSDEGYLLIDPEWPSRDFTDGIARGEVTEELSAVVVNARARADNDLVVESRRLPCRADARSDAPLAAGERGAAYSLSSILVIAGDDESALGRPKRSGCLAGRQRAGGCDVGVKRGIEVKNASVLLGEAAVPVVADAAGESEVRLHLELVLQKEAELVGPVVTIGIALQERGDVEVVIGGDQPLHELAEIGACNRARVGPVVNGVELGEAIAAAEADGVFSAGPDGISGGLQAILEDACICSLRGGVGTDIQRVTRFPASCSRPAHAQWRPRGNSWTRRCRWRLMG